MHMKQKYKNVDRKNKHKLQYHCYIWEGENGMDDNA